MLEMLALETMRGRKWRIGDLVEAPPNLMAAPDPMPKGGADVSFWFVVQVQFARERAVREDLRAAGFQAYVPMRKLFIRRPRASRRVKSELPVFPGYVFVDLVPEDRCFVAVRAVEGVVRVLTLTNAETPVLIPDEIMGDLMAAEDMGHFDETRPHRRYGIVAGMRVVVAEGVHAGREGAVVARRGKSSADVLLDGMAKPVRLSLDVLLILA